MAVEALDLQPVLGHLTLAAAIGLLVGVERGFRTRDLSPGRRVAGVRTYTLIGLSGALVALVGQALGGGLAAAVLLAAGGLALLALIGTLMAAEAQATGRRSITGVVAAGVVYACGALVIVGDHRVAAAAGIATAGILVLREPLHGLVGRIGLADLRAALLLLAMTFVVLPVLPRGPQVALFGLDVAEIWLLSILLAAVGFAGFLATKYLGARRGVLLSAAAGGLVSSTAVTLAHARRARAGEAPPDLLAGGTLVAGAVSALRTLGLLVALAPAEAVAVAAPALGAVALVQGGLGLAAARARIIQPLALQLGNPFDLRAVLGFALLLALVSAAGQFVAETFGAGGAMLAAAAIGLGDVDAVTLAVPTLVPLSLDAQTAGRTVLAAVGANLVAKAAYAGALAPGRHGWHIVLATVLTLAAGLAAHLLAPDPAALLDWLTG